MIVFQLHRADPLLAQQLPQACQQYLQSSRLRGLREK